MSVVDPAAFEALSGKEYQRAFYSAAENPQKATAFIIYIDAAINGKRTFIRKISPAISRDGKNPYVTAVDSTVQAFLSNY